MLNSRRGLLPTMFVLLAFVLVFGAACSSGDDDVTTTSSSGTAAEPAAAAAAPAAAAAAAAPVKVAVSGIGAQEAAPAAAPVARKADVSAAPVEAKVNRVIFGLITPSTEHYTPAKQGPPTSQPLTPMYEYLVGMDPVSGALIPQLATEWEVDADGKSWRFKLRKGVQFHNGWGEFTGKDVKHTWQQIAADDALHGNHGSFKRFVSDVEIVNDYEVVFRAPNPTADLFILTSELSQSLLIQSKDHRDAAGLPTLGSGEGPTAGTGPYRFTKGVPGSLIRYERTPSKHWRMTPDFQELEIRWMPEASTRLAGLLAGEIHLTIIPQDNVEQAKKAGMKLVTGNVPGLRTFFSIRCCVRLPADLKNRLKQPAYDAAFKYPDAPMQDIRVREAINRAIDRDALNTAFFGGKGETMVLNNFHPTREGWNPSWAERFESLYGYDPAKAKALLADAGYGPNNVLEIGLQSKNLSHYSGSLDVVDATVEYLRAIGIKPKLIVQDSATESAEGRAFKQSNRLTITGTSSHLLLGIRVYATHSTPRTGNPEWGDTDKLFIDIRGTLDPVKQLKWLDELGELTFLRYQTVPLFWLPPEAIVNPDIVSDYIFPGAITSTWTHLEFIKAAQ